MPNHVVTSRIEEMPEELHEYREQLEGRSILVKKAEVISLEAIVRGYITGEQHLKIIEWISFGYIAYLCFFFPLGSAWAEYKKTRTVHGIPLPEGLQESQKLPTPLFTPSTKAEQGAHDENISPEQGDVPIPLPPTTYRLTPNERYEQRRRSSAKIYTTEFLISL